MKRRATIGAVLVLAAAALASGCGAGKSTNASTTSGISGSIVFAGFGGRTDEAAAKYFFTPFTKATGVKVSEDPAAEDFVAKLRAAKKAGNVTWSLARLEQEDSSVLWHAKMLQPLPKDLKARLQKVSAPGAVTDYGVAYIDYSSVLVCNKSLVARCPRNMRDFWDTKRFPGRRMLYADGWLDNIMFALEADGVPKNRLFPLDVDRGLRKLDQIRKSINVWWTNSEQAEQAFRSGEVAMGAIWSGRATLLASSSPKFRISFDGAIAARELLVVPVGAPNPKAGFALMEWYASHPRAQARFIVERRNGLSNPKAFDYIPPEIAANVSTAPKNAAQSVGVDFGWVVKHRDAVYRRWQEWLTK